MVIGIILDYHRVGNARDDFTDRQIVIGKFIIPVRGYLNLSLTNEIANLFKRLAHRK